MVKNKLNLLTLTTITMLHNFKTAFTHFAKGEKLQGRDLAIVFSVVAILFSVAYIVLQTVLAR